MTQTQRSQTFAGDRGGATAVEFAFLLPPLLFFLFGVMELGRLFFTQSSLQYAVSQAARCRAVGAAACATDSQTTSYAASKVSGANVNAGMFSVSNAPSCGIQVSASLPYQAVKPIPISVTLTAKACHPTSS